MRMNEKDIKKFEKKHTKMLSYGIKHKLIFTYPDILFDRLRPYHVGGLPASIMLFITELCNGKCYDRSLLMQLALKDCEIVHADIETLRVTAGESSAEHSFVVTRDFGGGKEWVVDTSMCLIYDKNYYYKFEKPKINRVISKEECMDFIGTKEIIAGNFENDKYMLPLYLPFIENCIKNSKWLGTILYRNKLLSELEAFKQSINYDQIRKEIDDDIKLMKTDPKKLDEKFKIVRDEHGREISRNGIVNPYYVSFEEINKRNKEYEEAKKDEKTFKVYMDNLIKETIELIDKEDTQTEIVARRRLEEILENPTANFYDNCAYGVQNIRENSQSKNKR